MLLWDDVAPDFLLGALVSCASLEPMTDASWPFRPGADSIEDEGGLKAVAKAERGLVSVAVHVKC
jgi:hypothetical protein